MTDFAGMKYSDPGDKWYRYKGVAPPKRQSHGVSEDNIESIIKSNNDHTHKWFQKGPYVYCTAGPNEHGKNVGVYRRLQGTDKNGKPILVKI